jgi:His-Xaa-Ser system protein HxsD
MVENNVLTLKVDMSIYPLSAVYAAAYVFLDRAYVLLDKGAKNQVIVQLKGKEELTEPKKTALRGEFGNELLNCALRESIAKENVKIREYVVGQALYSSVQDMTAAPADADYLDDPLEIAVPWEEKYGDKAKSKKKSKSKVKA